MGELIDRVKDAGDSLLHDRTRRIGTAVDRVARSLNKGVDPEVLALQMNKNLARNHPDEQETFTAGDMKALALLFRASRKTTALSKRQAGELQRNQAEADAEFGDGLLT